MDSRYFFIALKSAVRRKLLQNMVALSSRIELILAAKNLERIGDHATNISEDFIYIVQGQDVRHPTVDRR